MSLIESAKVVWRPVGRAEKIPTIIGRPVRDAWLREEIATLSASFAGDLFAALRDMAEAARERKMFLPIQSLRSMVGHEFPELISLESGLGLDLERRSGVGCAIALFDPDQDLIAVKGRVLSCIKWWIADYLVRWEERHKLGELSTRVLRACTEDGLQLQRTSRPIRKPNGELDYDLALRVIAERLDGEELFQGVDGCILRAPVERSSSLQLLTPPFLLGSQRVSMRANISLSNVPFTKATYLVVSATKINWANWMPASRLSAGFKATAYVFAPERHVLPVGIQRERGGEWAFDDGYDVARVKSKNSLPLKLEEALKLAVPDASTGEMSAWWVGLPQTTRLYTGVGHRTVLEVDEFDLLKEVQARCAGILEEHARMRSAQARWKRTVTSVRMMTPDDLNIRVAGADDLAEGDAPTVASIAPPAERMAASSQQLREALQWIHKEQKPKVWIFCDGKRETDLIKQALEVMFGDAVLVDANPIPSGTHGLRKDLPQAQGTEAERFEARVIKWKEQFGPNAQHAGPKFALICAPDTVGGEAEDRVNYYAGIKALCSLGVNVHHVLPIAGEKQSHLESFVHRLQSATMDVMFAHYGIVLGLESFISSSVGERLPIYIHGLQVVDTRARSAGEQDVVFVLQTRLAVRSGITEVRYVHSMAGRVSVTNWMPLAEAIRWLASKGRIGDGKRGWLVEGFESIVRSWLDDVYKADPYGIALVDWQSTAGKIRSWSDGSLNKDGPIKIDGVPLSRAYPDLTIVRIRRGEFTMAVRAVSRQRFEAHVEGSRTESSRHSRAEEYLTSTKVLVELLPEVLPEGFSRQAHFVASMGYSRNPGFPRGLSCYRSVERFRPIGDNDEDVPVQSDAHERDYSLQQSGACTKDCSVPSPQDITILSCPEGVNAAQYAKLIMGLRVGYVHYNAWTTLPAPLFFVSKVRDHVIRFERPEWAPDASEDLVEPEVVPERTTLAEVLLSNSNPAEASERPGLQEISLAPVTVRSEEDDQPPSTRLQLAPWRKYDRMPRLCFEYRNLYRELLQRKVHVDVELPYFATQQRLFPFEAPDRGGVHRAWMRLRRSFSIRQTDNGPTPAQFYSRLYHMLRIPQAGFRLLDAQNAVTFTDHFAPINDMLKRALSKWPEKGTSKMPYEYQVQVLTELANSEAHDEDFAWLYFAAAQTPSPILERALDNLSIGARGPASDAAIEYWNRCAKAVNDIIQAGPDRARGKSRWFYPAPEISTMVQPAIDSPPNERSSQSDQQQDASGDLPVDSTTGRGGNSIQQEASGLINRLVPGDASYEQVKAELQCLLQRFDAEHADRVAEAMRSMEQQTQLAELQSDLHQLIERYRSHPLSMDGTLRPILDSAGHTVTAVELAQIRGRITAIANVLTELDSAYVHYKQAEARESESGLSLVAKRQLRQQTTDMLSKVEEGVANLEKAVSASPVVLRYLTDGGTAESIESAAITHEQVAVVDSAAVALEGTPETLPETASTSSAPMAHPCIGIEPSALAIAQMVAAEEHHPSKTQSEGDARAAEVIELPNAEEEATESDAEIGIDETPLAIRYLGEEERAEAHSALMQLTEKRRYGLASIAADALCYALEGEGYGAHRPVLHAMFRSLDAMDCRLATDVHASEALIDTQGASESHPPECQPEYFAMGIFAALMPSLFFDETAQRYRPQFTQFLGQRFREIPPLHALIQSIAEIDYGRGVLTRERCMAIHVDVKQAIGATLNQMKQRAKSWLSDYEMRSLDRHRGVSRINSAIFAKEGVLGRAIDLIVRGDARRLEQLYEDQIQKIKNKPGAHVEEAARRLKEKNTPDGKFRQFLVQNIEVTVGFVEEFIRLSKESDGKQRVVLADQQSFLESIYRNCELSIAALGDLRPGKPIELVYLNGVRIALNALMRIFRNDTTHACLSVPDQRLLIQLPMNSDLLPQFSGDDALCTISEVAREMVRLAAEDLGDRSDVGGIDEDVLRERMEDALSKHTEEKRFYPANRIAERYGLEKKVNREHLEALRMLERAVRDINYEVQHAYLLSAIDPSLGNQLQRVLEKVRSGIDEQNLHSSIGGSSPRAGGYVDIPHANHALAAQVQGVLNNKLNAERDRLARWLDDFEERNSELEQEVEEIRAMMSKGQKAGALRTALDAFNTLKADGKLPRGISDRPRVAETYSKITKSFHQFGTGGHQAFLDQFRTNLANPPSEDDPEWLSSLDDSARRSALEFLRKWVDICSIRPAPSDDASKKVEAFFEAMECPSMPTRRLGGQPSQQAVHYWDVSPFKGLPEAFVPPELGSQCSMLEAAIMSGGKTNTDIRRLVGQGGNVPRIIFVRACLPLEERAEVSQDAPVLLLDDYLAIYMALRPHQRLKAFLEVALLTFRAHPYKDYENGSVPFEMFYGREAEREKLNRVSGAAVLYGGRRLGKTSLFGRILHDHEKSIDIGSFAVMVSLLDVAPDDQAPLNAWKKIYEKLNANRPIRLVADIHGRPDKYEDYVGHIRAELIKGGSRLKSLYLLIDEADKVMQRELNLGGASKPSFVRSLSALVDNLKGIVQLRYCVAGLHNLTRMTNEENSPLGKVESIALEPYNTSEDRTRGFSLVTQPLEALGFEFEDRMMPWHIMSICNFYPAFIQMYCMRLLDCLYNARQGSCPPLKITHEHLENTERDQQLLGLLREKFKYNLDLDKRYMAIALLLADRFYSESGSAQMDYGLSTTSVRELCKTMFPEHFKMTGEGAYEALLNEMVKLNILDQYQGKYVLRNPHIAMMMGDEHAIRMRMDELEAMTPEEARSPGERRIRAEQERASDAPPVLFPMPQGWIRNVVDAVGANKSTAAPMPVIINHGLSGFDHFVRDGNASWKLFGGDVNLEFSRPNSPQDILQKEKALRPSVRHSRKTLLVVEQKRNLRLEQADEYAEVSKRLQKHGVQLVLLMPLDVAVEAAKRFSAGSPPPATWSLQRVPTWTDDGIYYYLGENVSVADSTLKREEILRATAGYGEIAENFRVDKVRPSEVPLLADKIKARYAPTLERLLHVLNVPECLRAARGVHVRETLALLHESPFEHDVMDSIVGVSDGIDRWEYEVMSWLGLVRVDERNCWDIPDLYRLAPSKP